MIGPAVLSEESTLELTAEFVQRLVERLFPLEERTPAAAPLGRNGAAAHEREPIRVRVAALKLCRGRLAELERLMSHARQDYRDRAQYLAWLAEHRDRDG